MKCGSVKRPKAKHRAGDYSIEMIVDNASRLHDYGLRRSAWLRGVRLMRRFGSEEALGLMESRADSALARGDLAMCHRWRDLMVVVHAIEADEPLPTDRIH